MSRTVEEANQIICEACGVEPELFHCQWYGFDYRSSCHRPLLCKECSECIDKPQYVNFLDPENFFTLLNLVIDEEEDETVLSLMHTFAPRSNEDLIIKLASIINAASDRIETLQKLIKETKWKNNIPWSHELQEQRRKQIRNAIL